MMTERDSQPLSLAGFVKYPRIMLYNKDVSPAASFLYLVIADHCRPNKAECYPSQERLSLMSGFSTRHIRTLLAELEEKGYVVCELRGRNTLYQLPHHRNHSSAIAEIPEPQFPEHRNHSSAQEEVLNKNNIREEEQVEEEVRTSEYVQEQPSPSSSKINDHAPKTIEEVEQALAYVREQLPRLQIGFPEVDVYHEIVSFEYYARYGNGNKLGPNPSKWINFLGAFIKQWLEKARDLKKRFRVPDDQDPLEFLMLIKDQPLSTPARNTQVPKADTNIECLLKQLGKDPSVVLKNYVTLDGDKWLRDFCNLMRKRSKEIPGSVPGNFTDLIAEFDYLCSEKTAHLRNRKNEDVVSGRRGES